MSNVEVVGRWVIGGMVCALVMAAVPQLACGSPDPADVAARGVTGGDETAVPPGEDKLQDVEADREEGPRELVSFDPELGLSREWTADLDGMVERRHLRALVVYSKTHYFLDGASQRGLSYEALREFEKFLNRRLGSKVLKVNVVIVPIRRDELIPALERGLGDLAAANLTVTPERLERVDFSRPFADGVRELVVTGPSGPKLSTLDDLAGRQVYVRRSTSYWASLEALNRSFAERGLQPVEVVPVDEFLEDEDLLEMVSSGVLPATVVDDHLARFWSGVLEHLEVHDDLAVREGGSIAWAVRKGCPQLKAVMDDFAAEYRVGTLTANVLLKRYLEANPWVRNPLARSDRLRFESTFHLFEKYGRKYDFDEVMLTALAYQESRLDQSTRSRAGAVGVMQIKPETAADPNVGIPDVEDLESNIHAGTKYLRFIRDRYFSDPEVDSLNQMLLTFAAYNAGPARVAQLRRDAEARGLDPDVWFGNVEVAAARRVGRETVQYVSNIAKYYVAYRLAVRQMDARAAAGSGDGG